MTNVYFASYIDDNTPYNTPNKCQLITTSSDEMNIYVKNNNITISKCKKLLDIKIDNKLNFDNHKF